MAKTENPAQDEQAQNQETAVSNPFDGKNPEEIKAILEKAQADLKALKLMAKGEKPKAERVNKGVMVTFTNKAGEQITGLGVLYYVTRAGGKLHYKEASNVHVLTQEEIDALPKANENLAD